MVRRSRELHHWPLLGAPVFLSDLLLCHVRFISHEMLSASIKLMFYTTHAMPCICAVHIRLDGCIGDHQVVIKLAEQVCCLALH